MRSILHSCNEKVETRGSRGGSLLTPREQGILEFPFDSHYYSVEYQGFLLTTTKGKHFRKRGIFYICSLRFSHN